MARIPRLLLVLCAAAASFGLALRQIRATSPAYDEPVHLAAGLVALERGQLINGLDHPPLAEMWAAAPLAAMRASTLLGTSHWGRLYNYADAVLYKNVADAGRMLTAARAFSASAWLLLFCAVCVLWAWSAGGPRAAAFAGFFCASYPLIWSNAAVVGTDAASAAFFAGAFYSFSRPARGRAHWIAGGLCMGLALASKFNMIALPVFAAALLLAEQRVEPERRPELAGPLLACAVALLALAVVYRGDLAAYGKGLTTTFQRLSEGRPSYLAGHRGTTGWWWYFPLALALKTPASMLLLVPAGAALVLRGPRAAAVWLVLPPAFYLASACVSKTQIGVRHVLPAAPFFCVLAGLAAARLSRAGRAGAAAAGLAVLLQAVSVSTAPADGLTYFNLFARGGGDRWLVDSNLDWGQGLPALAEELRARGNPPVYLAYFGVGDPSYYGIRHCPFAWSSNVDRRDGVVCPRAGEPALLAVSATNLRSVYFRDDLYAWLDPATAIARPDGGSILLFDVPKEPASRQAFVELARRGGAIIP